MEVILSQDVAKLGKAGSVVKVKDGFARNFLLPNKLAVPVSPANLKTLEEKKLKDQEKLEKIKSDAGTLKQKLEALSLTIAAMINEEEKLYGSIGQHEIAVALKEEGIEVDKNVIILNEPIRSLGIYTIPIQLHQDIAAQLKVWIVKK
ncbi:MAG: 50S ribosomal protein L9 [Candidatus Omnitrophota bacterium]